MTSPKPIEEASQDIAADLAALRQDVAKLTASVGELLRAEASATTNTVLGAVDSARRKLADGAAEAQGRVGAVGSDLEATIERNPLMAVLIAMVAGLLIGMFSRTQR